MINYNQFKQFNYGSKTQFLIENIHPNTVNVGNDIKNVFNMKVRLTDIQGISIEETVTIFENYNPGTPFSSLVNNFQNTHPECFEDDGSLQEASLIGKSGIANTWLNNGYTNMNNFQFNIPAPQFTGLDGDDE